MRSADALDPDRLYHLATVEEWERYREAGLIEPPSLATEGFVHCSWGRQIPGTVAKHFVGVSDLLALELDPGRLGDQTVVEEDSYRSGQNFPHIYGPIPVDTITGVIFF